jgi:DNA-binding response OmpR family regulator
VKKVLIVDDEVEFAAMVKMRLEANGYAVDTASNGEDCLRKVAAGSPNLILLDVMMPGMDGFQTLWKLRETPGSESIPVVMLTARGESKSILKAQDYSVTDYLIKPCDSEELLRVVRRNV